MIVLLIKLVLFIQCHNRVCVCVCLGFCNYKQWCKIMRVGNPMYLLNLASEYYSYLFFTEQRQKESC